MKGIRYSTEQKIRILREGKEGITGSSKSDTCQWGF
jgi:hypothetical protein